MVRNVTGIEKADLVRGPVPQSYIRVEGVGRSGACVSEPEHGACIRIVGAKRLSVTHGEKQC